jgi:hypothetical protein
LCGNAGSGGHPFTYDLFDPLKPSEFGRRGPLVLRIVWATELLQA